MALQDQAMLKFLPVLFILALFPGTARAQEGCEPAGDIPVAVTPLFEDPQYNFGTDIGGIRNMLNDSENGMQETHTNLPLGVPHSRPVLELHLPVTSVSYSDGLTCVHVERADITIGYRAVTVYV